MKTLKQASTLKLRRSMPYPRPAASRFPWPLGPPRADRAVAPHIEMVAAEAAAAVVLPRKILFDLPHGAGAVAVENVRLGQSPAQIDGPAGMHGEQLADVV